MSGTVFSIEEFSIYDGPGIRTTVFLKGCPMRCRWCHNPEGQSFSPEVVRKEDGTVRISGQEYEAEALVKKLLRNASILSHGGGVTFSGGEPLAQPDFLAECLDLLAGKLHTAIQTAGNVPAEVFDRVAPKADYILYDLKLVSDEASRRFTGCGNAFILRNFDALTRLGLPFTVRTPLIPGVTDTEENLSKIAALLHRHGVDRIELLPYNKMAGGKYASLGRTYEPGFDEEAPPEPGIRLFASLGIEAAVM